MSRSQISESVTSGTSGSQSLHWLGYSQHSLSSRHLAEAWTDQRFQISEVSSRQLKAEQPPVRGKKKKKERKGKKIKLEENYFPAYCV